MNDPSLPKNELIDDPRIAQARQLIRETVREHQQRIDGIRPPQESRKETYAQLLSKMGDLRGGGLYYRYLGSGLGHGPLVELADGSVKYDMISGIGVHIYGHSHPGMIDTLVEAALGDTLMQGNLQQNLDSLALCDDLVGLARENGSELEHCFLSTSGATANENALKMLFQKSAPADRMLTFRNSFSGRTMALAQLTDRPKNREGLPTSLLADYVPFYDGERPEDSTQASIASLREHLARYPGRHAGMCLELIQGEGGYYAAPREYFVALFDVLREHDVPIWIDEVQTFGRTTRMFAFQHLGLDEYPDIVTIGKMSQVCATLFTDAMKARPGLISQTFTGATSSIHAARFLLQQFREGGFLGHAGRTVKIHDRFVQHFERLSEKYPDGISGPWGVGGMIAFTVFDGSAERTKAFLNQLFEAGVIAFPAGGNPTRVRMLPPLLVLKDEDIDAVCDVIEKVLADS
jgi:acetylornithine aminotransferase